MSRSATSSEPAHHGGGVGGGRRFAATLIEIADWFSQEIIEPRWTDFLVPERVGNRLVDPLETDGLGLMLVIVIGILLVITSIVQLLDGGPLRHADAAGRHPAADRRRDEHRGRDDWFKRAVSWLAGFILYKPVAALIYATAIKLIGRSRPKAPPEGTPETLKVIMGVTMMIIAVVALPAILRFVSPRTS